VLLVGSRPGEASVEVLCMVGIHVVADSYLVVPYEVAMPPAAPYGAAVACGGSLAVADGHTS